MFLPVFKKIVHRLKLKIIAHVPSAKGCVIGSFNQQGSKGAHVRVKMFTPSGGKGTAKGGKGTLSVSVSQSGQGVDQKM